MRRHDRRRESERRVRAAWREGPGPGLRLAGLLFGAASDLRNLAYESGLASAARPLLPLLSVGGLTVGGSGKTPVCGAAAGALLERGVRPAVVTRGFTDELAVHRRINPRAVVLGAPDRLAAVEEAAGRGAAVAVLDDGFQHRRVARDLEWVVVSAGDLHRHPWRRLPAGPARDRWGELARADAIVVTSRPPAAAGDRGVRRRIARQFPAAVVASCEIRPTGLRPANRAAREAGDAAPSVAFASVMRGREFLSRLGREHPEIRDEYLFPDHHTIDDETLAEMRRSAAGGGLVGTLKDAVKLVDRLDPAVPLWYAAEEVRWAAGGRALAVQLDRLAAAAGDLASGNGADGRERRS